MKPPKMTAFSTTAYLTGLQRSAILSTGDDDHCCAGSDRGWQYCIGRAFTLTDAAR
jgi:hypothetical protein